MTLLFSRDYFQTSNIFNVNIYCRCIHFHAVFHTGFTHAFYTWLKHFYFHVIFAYDTFSTCFFSRIIHLFYMYGVLMVMFMTFYSHDVAWCAFFRREQKLKSYNTKLVTRSDMFVTCALIGQCVFRLSVFNFSPKAFFWGGQ